MISLSDKKILITGATSGFGLALARMAAAQGARVIATGRRAERLAALHQEHPTVHTLCFDISDQEAMEAAISSLPEQYRDIDVLVNNAGLALGIESFEEKKPEHIAQMVQTNIQGLLSITHLLLPPMVARGSGHIVNISSIAGSYPYPGGNVYGASKAFVTQFSLNLRADLLGKNIRVTSIEPGMCDTEFSTVRYEGDTKKAGEVYEGMQPLSADDIARSVLWCITQPEHVNVNRLEIMPVQQAFSPFAVSRD